MRQAKEGDVFEVELGDGLGKVVGVLARGKGLVFVFLGEPRTFRPDDAAFVGIIGVQGFRDGSWHIRGPLPGFTREAWPVPRFGRFLRGLGEERYPRIVTRDESLAFVEEVPGSAEEVARLPEDGVDGAGSAVIAWRKLARQVQAQHHHAA